MTYRSSGRGWVLAGCLSALVAGCGGEWERFFIVQNQVPEDGCVIPATKGSNYIGSGTMDVALVDAHALTGYVLFPLLQNDLPSVGGAAATEPNRLALREFRVRLELAPGAPEALTALFASPELQPYLAYSEPWSGSVDPGGGSTAASVTVVPAEVARRIDGTGVLDTLSTIGLTARVRAVGDTLSDSIESREFLYPISVCKGCLISLLAPCPYQALNTGNQCNIAQDGRVDCCGDATTLMCPARAVDSATN